MNRGGLPKVIPVVLIVAVIVIAIVAIASIGRSIFGGNDTPDLADPGQSALLNTTSTYSVRMSVRGPIVAQEDFRSYEITVSPNQRNITTYEGYLETVLESQEFSNNVRAYEELVYALDRAQMMEGEALEGGDNDVRGICATGRVYEFQVRRGNTVVKELWTTNCENAEGSLKANLDSLSNLFTKQIPDARKIIRAADLN